MEASPNRKDEASISRFRITDWKPTSELDSHDDFGRCSTWRVDHALFSRQASGSQRDETIDACLV
ncbi:hypothetical protein AJ87_15120 [Rhizobium yanglingense]|nr:hypothetical protein AJ87_15120 [Rhizobium yanglingense]